MRRVPTYRRESDRLSRRKSSQALLVAGVGAALKQIYDPVAEAALPLYFGRPLGWLYFVTSEESKRTGVARTPQPPI